MLSHVDSFMIQSSFIDPWALLGISYSTVQEGWYFFQITPVPVESGLPEGSLQLMVPGRGCREEGNCWCSPAPSRCPQHSPENQHHDKCPGAKHGVQDAKVRKSWHYLGHRKASQRKWQLKGEIAIDQRKKRGGEGAIALTQVGQSATCGKG